MSAVTVFNSCERCWCCGCWLTATDRVYETNIAASSVNNCCDVSKLCPMWLRHVDTSLSPLNPFNYTHTCKHVDNFIHFMTAVVTVVLSASCSALWIAIRLHIIFSTVDCNPPSYCDTVSTGTCWVCGSLSVVGHIHRQLIDKNPFNTVSSSKQYLYCVHNQLLRPLRR